MAEELGHTIEVRLTTRQFDKVRRVAKAQQISVEQLLQRYIDGLREKR